MKKTLFASISLLLCAPLLFSCSSDNEDAIEKNPAPAEDVIKVENTYWVSDTKISDFDRLLPAYYIEFQSQGKCMVYEYQSPGSGIPGYMVGNPLEFTQTDNNISIIEEYWDISTDPGQWANREYGTCSITSATELTFVINSKSYRLTKTDKEIDSFNESVEESPN